MITEYDEQANAFAKKWGVKLVILGCDYRKYFPDDKESRYVFKCRLARNGKTYSFEFGQSYYNGSAEPRLYDILSCLQKYDIGSFEDFCAEFGYDTDSRKAERVYKAVCKEYNAVIRLFGDSEECMQELGEIN